MRPLGCSGGVHITCTSVLVGELQNQTVPHLLPSTTF